MSALMEDDKLLVRLVTTLLGIASLVTAVAAQAGSLAEIYRTGAVRLIEEVRITDKELPEGLVFQNPLGIAVDPQGRVYVADAGAEHIKVFGPDGRFIRTIGRKGQGPGEFQGPEFVEVGGGRIFVWESMNRRTSILDAGGAFITSTPSRPFMTGAFGVFIRMRALPDGRLVVHYERGKDASADDRPPEGRVQVIELLSAEAKPLRILLEQGVVTCRFVWNASYNANVRVPFPYHPTLNMEATPAGDIVAGYNAEYKIDLFHPTGRSAGFSRPYSPIRLEEKDRQAHFGRFRMAVFKDGMKTIVPKPPDVILKNTEFPERLPPYRGLAADGEGNVWVQVNVESRATNVFDVFDPKTGFVARITVDGPIDYSFAASLRKRFFGQALWQIEQDEEGYSALVKYRLMSGGPSR
jgi:hypothetical protein